VRGHGQCRQDADDEKSPLLPHLPLSNTVADEQEQQSADNYGSLPASAISGVNHEQHGLFGTITAIENAQGNRPIAVCLFRAEAALIDAALLRLDAFASFAEVRTLINRGLNICQG
jgi:hypothetical protein